MILRYTQTMIRFQTCIYSSYLLLLSISILQDLQLTSLGSFVYLVWYAPFEQSTLSPLHHPFLRCITASFSGSPLWFTLFQSILLSSMPVCWCLNNNGSPVKSFHMEHSMPSILLASSLVLGKAFIPYNPFISLIFSTYATLHKWYFIISISVSLLPWM